MIIIKQPQTKEDFKVYYALRYHVLRESLGLAKGTEKDDYEPISIHYMAVDDKTHEVLGVVKLFEKSAGIGQFSHLAVLEEHRSKGTGHLLIQTVEDKSRELGYHALGTLTRLTATEFYEKCGYICKGLATVLFGRIQMMWMEKEL